MEANENDSAAVEQNVNLQEQEPQDRRKRGRPSKVLTPEEITKKKRLRADA